MPSMGGALRYLEFQVERRQFLRLFEELFPQEAKLAFAQAAKQKPEARFFQFVDERLFPISADLCIETLDSGDLPSGMPLQAINNYLDDWTLEGCTDNWGLAERVARFLATGFSDEREVLREIGLDNPFNSIGWSEWTCDLQIFRNLCTAVDPELSDAAQMIGLIEGATGNFWLDTSSEGMAYYFWDFSKESMLQLAQEYKEAIEILAVASRVIEYLNQRPQLLKQLVRCWQLSIRPAPAEKKSRENRIVSRH